MAANQAITIVDLPSPGSLGGVFSDLILALTHSFSALGCKVSYERRLIRSTDPVIVFGLYRAFINASPNIRLPPNYFNFNLAPIHEIEGHWFQKYLECARQNHLIDYSYNNIEHLCTADGHSRRCHLFNFGYFDLMPFNGFDRGDNFLFYGKLNEERKERLTSFQQAGVKLNVLQNCWGHERDIQIRQAKAVINIGKYNPNLLEVYRIWHSLCLGTPVYSDAGVDQALANHYSKYIHIVDRLSADDFRSAPVSPALYQNETSFMESTKALLSFVSQ